MPGGDAAGFPIVNVPPIFTGVRAGGETLVLNGDAGFELPIAKVTDLRYCPLMLHLVH